MSKISADHLSRRAVVYIRQSTADQVPHNAESRRRQYGLADRAKQLGWTQVDVIDDDLGRSGSGVNRPGFERLLTAIPGLRRDQDRYVMTGGAAPHRQCRRSASLVIDRQRWRLPGRGENAPIRAAVARSASAPALFGRHDDAHQLADILAQRCRRVLPMTTATPKSP